MAHPKLDDIQPTDLPIKLGRYELVSILGKGGMAQVFGAELMDPAGFRKRVAVKIIKAKILAKGSKRHVDFFIREARLGGLLRHPNIVDVYELGEVEGQLYIAMEHVEGMTLRDFFRLERLPPASVVLEIASGITAGLASAHRLQSEGLPAGLIHRDMKPSNILLSDEGSVKITDFGVAITLQGELAETQPDWDKIPGTLSYMSPEQMLGQPLDGRSDIFSLGLVLMELVLMSTLPRKLIFKTIASGESLTGCALRDFHFEPIQTRIPELVPVLKRCLQLQPEDRYSTAEKLLVDLEHLREKLGSFPKLHTWLKTDSPPPLLTVNPTRPQPQEATGDALQPTEPATSGPAPSNQASKRTNLVEDIDTFIGRSRELESIGNWISGETRLLTLKGTGGVGKTRLARKFAVEYASKFPGGTWFVDLTETRTLEGIIRSVAETLQVPLRDAAPPVLIEQLASAIKGRDRALLILDNFEQVIDHADATLGTWLRTTEHASFIVTSRAPTKIRGEHVFSLEPLSTAEGCNLFRARAENIGVTLNSDSHTSQAIEDIVGTLDGLPLAIELAAARTTVLSPSQIQDRLSQRFKLLRGGAPSPMKRQSTLEGLIQWSWELLEPWEQSALAQLSVFRDGFFMEAAEAVVDLSDWPEAPWTLDVVGSLYEKSLLHRWDAFQQPRFGMYSSIQAYAAQHLNESEPATKARHAAHYAQLANETYLSGINLRGGVQIKKTLAMELENCLQGASVVSFEQEPETAALCALAAAEVFQFRGPYSDGIRHLETALTHSLDRVLEARLQCLLARLYHMAGRFEEAIATYRKALQTARLVVNRQAEGQILGGIAHLQRENGKLEQCLENATESLNIAREVGDQGTVSTALGKLGLLYYERGLHTKALKHYEDGLQVAREIGHETHEGVSLCNIALLHQAQGRFSEAELNFHAAIQIARRIGNRRNEGICQGNLALIYRAQGRNSEAKAHYQKALKVAREIGNRRSEGVNLGNLGDFLFMQNNLEAAESCLRDAVAICDTSYPIAAGAFRGTLALLVAKAGNLQEAHRILELAEPQLRGVYRWEFAKFLCKKAQVLHLASDDEGAHTALEEADSLTEELDVLVESELGTLLQATRQILAG